MKLTSVSQRYALVMVLAIGYVLMSLLVMQQEQTIDSQRTLIQQLFHDSLELSAIKMHRVARR